MLSNLFLGMSLMGAEWVLYLLVLLSIVSVSLIFERVTFYRAASRDLDLFRKQVREAASSGRWADALRVALERSRDQTAGPDLETGMTSALLVQQNSGKSLGTEILTELAQDQVLRARLSWDKNLAVLATIGNNAPFVGLFGTVLGIIKAFHDLSKQSAQGVSGVTAGVSEALVATAVGILVAIPAVVAFNYFQRRVKAAMAEAEAMKSFLIGHIAGDRSGS